MNYASLHPRCPLTSDALSTFLPLVLPSHSANNEFPASEDDVKDARDAFSRILPRIINGNGRRAVQYGRFNADPRMATTGRTLLRAENVIREIVNLMNKKKATRRKNYAHGRIAFRRPAAARWEDEGGKRRGVKNAMRLTRDAGRKFVKLVHIGKRRNVQSEFPR